MDPILQTTSSREERGYYAQRGEHRGDHRSLEADKVLLGERVARALYKENRSGKAQRRKERRNAVVKRCVDAGHSSFGVQGRRVIKNRPTGVERHKLIARLEHRDGPLCFYCQRPFNDAVRRTIDHIVPISRRGTNALANLRLACEDCNGYRKNRMNITTKGAFRKVMAARKAG